MMETMTRSSWTDERLDDLSAKVDQGFVRVEACICDTRTELKAELVSLQGEMKEEFAAVRSEMREEFAAVRQEMKEEFAAVRQEMKEGSAAVRSDMKEGFGRIERRLDDQQKTINRMGIGIILTLIAAVLSQQL